MIAHRARRSAIVVIAAMLTLSAASACGKGSRHTRGTAVIYGDSLVYEATNEARSAIAKQDDWLIKVHSFPGSAPCDWFHQLRHDLKKLHPDLVVLETAGNAWTDCMRSPTRAGLEIGTAPYYAKYRLDLRMVYALVHAAGARAVFVEPVPVTSPLLRVSIPEVAVIATEEGSRFEGFATMAQPRNAVSVDGAFASRLPCLAGETRAQGCIDKMIRVREPDGLHFCPKGYLSIDDVTDGCVVYSSGAVRYGRALVAATIHALRALAPSP